MSQMKRETNRFDVLPRIESIGVSIFDPIWSERVHRPTFSELLYILGGTVDLVVRRRRYPGQAGDVLLVPVGAPHRDIFPAGTELRLFTVNFSWPCARGYFRQVPCDAARRLTPGARMAVIRLLDALRIEHRQTAADSALNRARLYHILMLLHDASAPKHRAEAKGDFGDRRRHALMLRTRAYLEQHYAEPLSLEGIARALRVSPYYLSHVFSAENEFPLSQFLISRRLEKARDLLMQGTHNVTEAARAVGYRDGDYFAKAFSRHFGRHPRDILG